MDVMEKLVELLSQIQSYGVKQGSHITHQEGKTNREIASHLIAHGVTVQELDGCNYCNVPVYVKTIQYTAPALAPVTRAEEIRQQLYNLTGEVYLELPKRFCPICGKEWPQPPKGENE